MSHILVKSVKDDGRVILWERNSAHPDGEAFIANNQAGVSVGRTPAVERLLSHGKVVELAGGDPPKPVVEPVAEPVVEPVAEPVVEPVAKPGKKAAKTDEAEA